MSKTIGIADIPRFAAAYVRMSTEHQQYSTSNQLDVIRAYASEKGLTIAHVFSDDGKSGLSISGRASLSSMIKCVESGNPGFSSILVYDVSRWGRFQDADESAYYEFICKRNGIKVHYCAEQFENDGSPVSTIVKGVKRAMAGEYSRELSAKVFQGACRLIQLGYKQGGTAGFGLRRMLVDQNGTPKGILLRGQMKSIQTDRVVLVPGPEEEIEIVRWIFQIFVEDRISETVIASILNDRGVKTDMERKWSKKAVVQILTHEKYIGNNIYYRTSNRLKRRQIKIDANNWVRSDGAWPAIVDQELFQKAQQIIQNRRPHYTDEELIVFLKQILKSNGRITGILLSQAEGSPPSATYRKRFGSLRNAYSLAGYVPPVDYTFIEENRRLRELYPAVVKSVVRMLEGVGAKIEAASGIEFLTVNGDLRVSIILCKQRTTQAGIPKWIVRLVEENHSDLTVAVRMEIGNHAPLDYFVFSALGQENRPLSIRFYNGIEIDAFRFDSLDYFVRLLRPTQIPDRTL